MSSLVPFQWLNGTHISFGAGAVEAIKRYIPEHSRVCVVADKYDHIHRSGVKQDVDKMSFRDAKEVFTEEQVKKETARCLSCGASIVDENQCIGCGLCTTRCEFDAIHLHRDRPECSVMRKSEDKLKYVLPNGLKQRIKVMFK